MSEWRKVEDVLEYLLNVYESERSLAEIKARREGKQYVPTKPEEELVRNLAKLLESIKNRKFDEIASMIS